MPRSRLAGSCAQRSASGSSGTSSPKKWATTRPSEDRVRVFFATDVHGSEVCWRKFLNAGAFHKADVLIMGGDMTGKAMVPITGSGDTWRVVLREQETVLNGEDELAA